MKSNMKKPHPPVRQLLFDFHTMPDNPDIGKNFDFDKIEAYFRRCKVDSVMFPFRCNQGFAYFPTETGVMYPGLQFDLLGRMIEVCRKIGVQITIYTNATVCVEVNRLHPDWALHTPNHTAYDNTVCSNSPFTQEICAMLREVTQKYEPDGIFLDFGYDPPCICETCLRKMKEEGIDWTTDPEAHKQFAIRSSMEKYHTMCKAALEHNPDILLCINGIPYEEKAEYSTHYEFECLQTAAWGYHQLPVFSHYLRNLGKTVTNMTGRFHGGWGDFGGLRPKASLEYDVFYALGNGMNLTLGDHFHPRGDMYPAVMDLVAGTMNKAAEVEDWTKGAEAETEIAVIVPKCVMDGIAANQFAVTGTARMLIELKQQFDIYSDAMPLRKDYKVIILPDETRITAELEVILRKHLDRGGKIISSMYSGLKALPGNQFQPAVKPIPAPNFTGNQNACAQPELADVSADPVLTNPEYDRFVFPEWGIEYNGISPWDPTFMVTDRIQSLPELPITVINRGTLVKLLPGTQMAAEYVAPYFNRMPRSMRYFQYLPPKDPTGEAAMTINDQVAHVTFPIFSSYMESGRVDYRKMVEYALDQFLKEPLVRTERAPSWSKVFVTAQPDRRMLHILANYPEKRTMTTEMIDDAVEIHNLTVHLRNDGREVEAAYLVPEKTPVSFVKNDAYTTIKVPSFEGHAMIAVEYKK